MAGAPSRLVARHSRPPLASSSPGLPPRGGVRLRTLVLIRWAAVAGQLFTAAGRPLGPGLHPAAAAGRRHDRPVGAAQSGGQPRPSGLGAHRRSRGHDLPRLRHRAARRAALSHRRPHQPVLAAADGAGRDRRHHPVAREQHRAVAAHHRQHRPARRAASAAAVDAARRPSCPTSTRPASGPASRSPPCWSRSMAGGWPRRRAR